MKVQLNNKAFRSAILKAHNNKCVYSGTPLDFENLTVDHIIPQTLQNNQEKLSIYLKKLEIEADNFDLESIYNLVPASFRLNREKGDDLVGSILALRLLELAKKKAPIIITEMEKFKDRKKINKSIEEVRSYVLMSDELKKEQVFDLVTEDHNTFKIERVIESGNYKHSTARIQFEAFLPIYPSRAGSCLITFRSLKIRECRLELSHEQIMKELFHGLNTDPTLKLRKFIVGKDNKNLETYIIHLGSTRIPVSIDELKQLCMIIDDFSNEYIINFQKNEEKLGTVFFNKSPFSTKYRLMKITRDLWNLMIDFVYEHDYKNGNSMWHMFDKNRFFIRVYTDKKTNIYDEGYHAFIDVEQDNISMHQLNIPDNTLWLVWEPTDYYNYEGTLEEINNRNVWDALTVYEWLTEELIPWVIFRKNKKESITIYKNRSLEEEYEGFWSEFHIENYITSGKLKSTCELNKIINQQQLTEFVEDLQMFFYVLKDTLVFNNSDFKNLFKALAMCIKRSETVDYKYIGSKIGFINGSNPKEISDEILSYSINIEYSIKNGYFIDNIFRCFCVTLRDNKSYLNKSEIQTIVNYIKPFLDRKMLIETIEKM